MAKQVFLYGIGAAKAGTTWLARCLRAHPECALPPIKETHYFDSVELGTSLWAVDSILRLRQIVRTGLSEATTGEERQKAARRVEAMDRWLSLIASGQRDDATYEALLKGRLLKHHKVVADITPAYALLGQSAYARMAALNGGQTRFLMILRDPMDRLCSNISMTMEKRAERGVDPMSFRADTIAKLSAGKDTEELARSDYAKTLRRLDASVPEQKRLTVYFEDLFQDETMKRISDFIGLDAPIEPLVQKINQGRDFDLSEAERAALAPRLKAQYEDALTRFGRVPERWQTNMQEARI